VHRGQLALMPASVAILAPGVNAFRRLRKNLTEPVFNSWGYNTRSALRIPCSDDHNRRIEYRLADANPYLVAATILTGMLYGLENIDDEDLPEPQHDRPELPLFQQEAIETLPAVSTSPTAWATPFPNSGSPASSLNSTGLSAL
jgi:gamma-glutamylputrescine synthase